jgi:hypothetical protein
VGDAVKIKQWVQQAKVVAGLDGTQSPESILIQ